MNRTRIILADEHEILLDAVRLYLEPEYEVVGTFSDGQTLLENAAALSPDLVILDVALPRINGLNAGSELKKQLPKIKLIYLTMNKKPEFVSESFKRGAHAYVLKSSSGSEFLKAIREVVRGAYFATPSLTSGMLGSFVQKFRQMAPPRRLTLRQKEVLQLLAEGRSMREIASILEISMRTVAFHKYKMMEALKLTTTAELINYALKYQPVGV